MNVYEKMQLVKEELLNAGLKKTGENKYANFKYYELSDFLPQIIKLCNKYKLYTKIIFDNDMARLVIKNIEKPEEQEEYTSPMRNLELKGSNEVQALGGVETYQRRYLYMNAFDIVENDMFDKVTGKQQNKNNITDKEAKEVYIKMKEKGLDNETIVETLLKKYGVDNTGKLTKIQYNEILKNLNK